MYRDRYVNPLFPFMVFVDSGDFSPDDVKELYLRTPDAQLPNAVCLIDQCVIMNMHISRGEDGKFVPDIPVWSPEFTNKTPLPEHRWAWWKMGPEELSRRRESRIPILFLHGFLSRCRLSRPGLYEYMDRLQIGHCGDIFRMRKAMNTLKPGHRAA